MYQNWQKFSEDAATFQRQLAVTAEVYGAESPENATPLTNLGSNAQFVGSPGARTPVAVIQG